MSYDIGLYYGDDIAQVESHQEGGTIAIGGVDRAEMNVTYNYGRLFRMALDGEQGIRWLYGKKGCETIERLEKAVGMLGTERYSDYWAPTPGNAGHALSVLLSWARQHPDAIWQGD